MKKFIFTFLCANMLILPAYSATCVKDYGGTDNSCVNITAPAGDCGDLGYTTDDVENCTNYIRCPFDTRYKICVAGAANTSIDCATLGFTADDKTNWCLAENIVVCPNNANLTLCSNYNKEAFTLDCEELGYTTEDKSSWCDNIVTCPIDDTLTFCASGSQLDCAALGFTETDKAGWCKTVVECPKDTTFSLCAEPCTYSSEDVCRNISGGICEQGSDGCWNLKSCSTGYENSGDKCVASSCPDGSSTTKTVNSCLSEYASLTGASVVDTGFYSGVDACKKCACEVPTNCQYTEADKGNVDNVTLSGICCDGTHYTGCTATFPSDVTVPSNATAIYKTYTACGQTKLVVTGFECDVGYEQSGSSCVKETSGGGTVNNCVGGYDCSNVIRNATTCGGTIPACIGVATCCEQPCRKCNNSSDATVATGTVTVVP